MKKIFMAICLLIAASTAIAKTSEETGWYHENYDPKIFDKDDLECRYESAKMTANQPILGPYGYIAASRSKRELIDLCMQSRGYSLTHIPPTTTTARPPKE